MQDFSFFLLQPLLCVLCLTLQDWNTSKNYGEVALSRYLHNLGVWLVGTAGWVDTLSPEISKSVTAPTPRLPDFSQAQMGFNWGRGQRGADCPAEGRVMEVPEVRMGTNHNCEWGDTTLSVLWASLSHWSVSAEGALANTSNTSFFKGKNQWLLKIFVSVAQPELSVKSLDSLSSIFTVVGLPTK